MPHPTGDSRPTRRGAGRPRTKNGRMQPVTAHKSRSDEQPPEKRQKTSIYQLSTLPNGRRGSTRNEALTDLSSASSIPEHLAASGQHNEDSNIPVEVIQQPRSVQRRSANQIRDWLRFRQWFLDEIIWHDGLGDNLATPQCRDCSANNKEEIGDVRCMECMGGELFCRKCIVSRHKTMPLHRVEQWTGSYFARTSLQELGLVVHLGHQGAACPNSLSTKRRFTVCDVTGFHNVSIAYCGCISGSTGLLPQWKQLLRIGWYPATRDRPGTAFTFRVLDFYEELTHQGKANLYDFCKTLNRITDNSGTVPVESRYKQFAVVIRQWRNLVLLKRSGRGHDPAGVDATGEGDCVVECAACPHPGRNLPDGWEKAPPHLAWIYVLYLMLDANFRLKLKDRGFDDVALSAGWAYCVADTKYKEFIAKFGDQAEENTCSAEHQAIRNANVAQHGYIASGSAGCLCNRHTLVRKNGIADLQKGEKYCSMDYVLLATLIATTVSLFVTYDIACQFSKNFKKRLPEFPPCMRLDQERCDSVRWAIPKKHWPVHGAKDHSRYSLNYLPYAGRTYGEGIESGWAHMNLVSGSTKEMAPSSRHETLDGHWGSWNWQKTIRFGAHFYENLREAFSMKTKHETIFEEFNRTFPADVIAKWKVDVERWEVNPSSKPDPFLDDTKATTMNDIKLKLATEETTEQARNGSFPHEVTPSVFLGIGLDIEDQQRVLRARAKGKHSVGDLAGLQGKRNALMHRIDAWRKIQDLYMPYVHALLSSHTQAADSADDLDDTEHALRVKAEDIPLFLPSSLPPHLRIGDNVGSLLRKEGELRIASADDALADIRRLRRTMMGISQFKHLNVSGAGQKINTRIRTLYQKFNDKVVAASACYRAAYNVLPILQPEGDWSRRFKELHDKDIRGPGNEDDAGLGEGRHEMSWIWLVQDRSLPSPERPTEEYGKTLQVEWSKTRARARRWNEETILLQEEMRRVLAFFDWKAAWWRSQASRRDVTVSDGLASGLHGYGEKQASMYEKLAQTFASKWYPLLREHDITPEWSGRYTLTESPAAARKGGESNSRAACNSSGSGESDSDDSDF